MKLPILVSLPHAGLQVPEELKDYCILSNHDIEKDGDEQAWEIYNKLEDMVEAFQTTNIARAFVDLNRAPDDIRLDGVVKTHTIWERPIYNIELPPELIQALIKKHWTPYHENLSNLTTDKVKLGIDCHTMAAVGPPVGPDTGHKRPAVCLSNADGTCPDEWIKVMAECFKETFQENVKINDPFTGGYIIKSHSSELPWIQIELSRGDFMSESEKSVRLIEALKNFCSYLD
jgi:formiminoglutamase